MVLHIFSLDHVELNHTKEYPLQLQVDSPLSAIIVNILQLRWCEAVKPEKSDV